MNVVEEVIALMRMTDDGDRTVATLADMVLGLVNCVRDYEMRIGLAEAALETERAKVAELRAALWDQKAEGQALRSQAKAVRLARPLDAFNRLPAEIPTV